MESIYEFLNLMEVDNTSLILSLNHTSLWPDQRRPILNLEDVILTHKFTHQLKSCDYTTVELTNNNVSKFECRNINH